MGERVTKIETVSGGVNYTDGAADNSINGENDKQNMQRQRPKVVKDIGFWPYMTKKDKEIFSIGSKTVDRYLMIPEEHLKIVMAVIKKFNGKNTIANIEVFIKRDFGTELDVLQLKEKLAKAGLIQGEEATGIASEIAVMGVDLFNISFPEIKPRARRSISFFWQSMFYISLLLFMGAGIGAIARFESFSGLFGQVFVYKSSYFYGALIASLFSILNITLHECSHWATAVRFGLQPTQFHMTLYAGVFPMWYVKIAGMYTVEMKKRVYIMASGMYMNAILIVIAINGAVWFDFPLETDQILAKLMIANIFQIIYCLSPLRLTDGYFIISSLAKMSNLRLKLLKNLSGFFHGEKIKMSPLLIGYLLSALGIMGLGFYTTLRWNFNVFFEIADLVDVVALKYGIITIPYLFICITSIIFIRKFFKFMNSSKLYDGG